MEPKRELTSVDLAAVVSELTDYVGMKVDKAYRYADDLVRLKCRDYDRGRIELFIEIGEIKRIHPVSPERVPDAPERPPQFAKMLRNRLSGADLVSVEQYEFDRIIELSFEREDGTTRLLVELFGQGNVAVTNGEYEVVDSLRTVRLSSRTVAPGARYEFPESRCNPLTLSREAFDHQMDDSDTDVVRTLATQLDFGGTYAEELCTRAGVEKTLAIVDADEETYGRLYEATDRLARDLREGSFDPRLYVDRSNGDESTAGDVVDVTPFPLEEYERSDLEAEPTGTFGEALDEYFHRLSLDGDEPDRGTNRPDFEAELDTQRRIIAQQEEAIEGFERAAQTERERAELLYAHYDLVDEILSTIRTAREESVEWDEIEDRFETGKARGIPAAEAVESITATDGTVTINVADERITLEVTDGVEKNADRLYTEAKRIEEKKEGALAAIEETRETLADIERRRDAWETADAADDSAESGEDETARDWLSASSIPIRENEGWYERFRWMHTSDGFLVIGGRNADQNEELVKKYLEPGDRVFHTQAHGAPVTVLKATDPSEAADPDIEIPETSLEEAATFAVTYSSVWKAGRYAGDVYMVDADQVSKTPESGEYLEKGGFAVRGERTYFADTPVACAVGIQCAPYTRVVGGPPSAIADRAETTVAVEPGRFAQADVAKKIYRRLRERFTDESFVRKIASPDNIQHFLPPGGSRIVDD